MMLGAVIVSSLKKLSLSGMDRFESPPTTDGNSSEKKVFKGINLSYPSTFNTAS